MLLFYVDESGITGGGSASAEGRARYFSMAAVGIRDSSRAVLASALHDLRVKYFGNTAVADSWETTELKARYLAAVAGAGGEWPPPYGSLSDKSRQANLVNDLRKVLARFRPLIFAVVVDKAKLPPGENPTAVAYAKLYERVALVLEHVNVGESALFIADRQDEHERVFERGEVHAARSRLASKGSLRPDFSLIIDRPIWLDPSVSTWDREIIQLADLVALPAREWAAGLTPPKEPYLLWEALKPLFAVHWNEGTPQKGGLVIYPPPIKYPAV